MLYGGQNRWYQISIHTTWYALYNLQPATIHLNLTAAGYDSSQPHSFLSPNAMEGDINDIISQYTWWYALYNLQPATIHLKPHFLFSPDAIEDYYRLDMTYRQVCQVSMKTWSHQRWHVGPQKVLQYFNLKHTATLLIYINILSPSLVFDGMCIIPTPVIFP